MMMMITAVQIPPVRHAMLATTLN